MTCTWHRCVNCGKLRLSLISPNWRVLGWLKGKFSFLLVDFCEISMRPIRLMSIARREKVVTDLTAMLALAEKTGNDVRSCLSMLQFFNSVRRPLTLIDVLKSDIGQKDRHKGLFGIWGAIFQVQRPRKMLTEGDVADLQIVSMTDMSTKTRMKNVLDVVHMGGGDYERYVAPFLVFISNFLMHMFLHHTA